MYMGSVHPSVRQIVEGYHGKSKPVVEEQVVVEEIDPVQTLITEWQQELTTQGQMRPGDAIIEGVIDGEPCVLAIHEGIYNMPIIEMSHNTFFVLNEAETEYELVTFPILEGIMGGIGKALRVLGGWIKQGWSWLATKFKDFFKDAGEVQQNVRQYAESPDEWMKKTYRNMVAGGMSEENAKKVIQDMRKNFDQQIKSHQQTKGAANEYREAGQEGREPSQQAVTIAQRAREAMEKVREAQEQGQDPQQAMEEAMAAKVSGDDAEGQQQPEQGQQPEQAKGKGGVNKRTAVALRGTYQVQVQGNKSIRGKPSEPANISTSAKGNTVLNMIADFLKEGAIKLRKTKTNEVGGAIIPSSISISANNRTITFTPGQGQQAQQGGERQPTQPQQPEATQPQKPAQQPAQPQQQQAPAQPQQQQAQPQ